MSLKHAGCPGVQCGWLSVNVSCLSRAQMYNQQDYCTCSLYPLTKFCQSAEFWPTEISMLTVLKISLYNHCIYICISTDWDAASVWSQIGRFHFGEDHRIWIWPVCWNYWGYFWGCDQGTGHRTGGSLDLDDNFVNRTLSLITIIKWYPSINYCLGSGGYWQDMGGYRFRHHIL